MAILYSFYQSWRKAPIYSMLHDSSPPLGSRACFGYSAPSEIQELLEVFMVTVALRRERKT